MCLLETANTESDFINTFIDGIEKTNSQFKQLY